MLFKAIILLAFISAYEGLKIDSPFVVLSVPNPPSSSVNFDNFTLIIDKNGQIVRIPIDEAPITIDTFFSAEVDVHFELFTGYNPIQPHILESNSSKSVKNSYFNPYIPTRIVVAGWNSWGWLTPRFADAYFSKRNYKVNLIVVNWLVCSDRVDYRLARNCVPEVGQQLARFIDFMVENHKLKLKDITIIGHSLGAHISGIAGQSVTKGKITRIVGLDPANPLLKFEEFYVEVIHTNAGWLGMSESIGTSDFYPNGGSSQPGCGRWDLFGMCNHGRVYEYYLESIERSQFMAIHCDSFEGIKNGRCTVIDTRISMGGEQGERYSEGIFYLDTNPSPLFSQGLLEPIQSSDIDKQNLVG